MHSSWSISLMVQRETNRITTERLLQPVEGSVFFDPIDKITYVYDVTRDMWIGNAPQYVMFGNDDLTRTQALSLFTGSVLSSCSGIPIIRNAVIVNMIGQLSDPGFGYFRIRKNDSSSNLDSLLIDNQVKNTKNNMNVLLDSSDILKCYFESINGCYTPLIIIEYFWRFVIPV